MSLEDFQLLDNESFDNSIIKRDFLKVYHQQGAQLNNADQNIEFIFGEDNNFYQIGNAYLEFDITVRAQNAADAFDGDSPLRLTNIGLAYAFQEARLSTSTTDLEHNLYLGQISTFMRVISTRDGDFLSQFDNINEEIGANEAAISDNIRSTSLTKMLITNHEEDANRGKIKGQLPLEHIFGFCKTFKKVAKNLGFHITFKTANLQDIIYRTIAAGTQINVTINSLYLFVTFLIPTTETQLMFNESTQNNYRIFLDEWYTELRIVADQIFQVDIGSAQSVNSPKFMICAHQTEATSALPNKRNNISIFDNINVRKYFIEIDG